MSTKDDAQDLNPPVRPVSFLQKAVNFFKASVSENASPAVPAVANVPTPIAAAEDRPLAAAPGLTESLAVVAAADQVEVLTTNWVLRADGNIANETRAYFWVREGYLKSTRTRTAEDDPDLKVEYNEIPPPRGKESPPETGESFDEFVKRVHRDGASGVSKADATKAGPGSQPIAQQQYRAKLMQNSTGSFGPYSRNRGCLKPNGGEVYEE